MSQAPAIVRPEREQWLARRRELITASDCAAILGVDPRRGPLEVYLEKTTDVDLVEETRWMRYGRKVEGAIADWYEFDTGRVTEDLGAHTIQQHPDLPWLGATLDRQTGGSQAHPAPGEGIRGPLEAKAVAGFKANDWHEDPPLHFVIQLQIQIACTKAEWGTLAALIGGVSLVWKDQRRDDDFLAAAIPALEAFRGRVLRRDPPPSDGLEGTHTAVKRAWPFTQGETIALEPDVAEMVDEWERLKAAKTEAEKAARAAEDDLRVRMGSASFGALTDGSFLTLKTTKRAGYVVEPTEFRVLRRQRPRLPMRRG